MSTIKNITDQTFAEEIQGDTPVLVDFWAEWCGPCRMTAPVLEQVAAELGDQLRIVKLNVDENIDTARQFQIMGIPTMLIFKDGQPVDEIVGFLPKPLLLKRLRPHLEKTAA